MIISLSIYLAGRWNPVAIDYAVFWKAVRRADPYRLDAYFVNPPPALLALQPLRLVGFVPGYVLWTALSLLLFFFAARRLVGDRAALLSLFSAASIHGLLLGQAPMMLGAAILFAVTAPALWCGVILGCVAAIKPQLLLAAPVILLARKDWVALGGMIAGGAALILLSAGLFGLQAWIDWAAALPSFNRALILFDVLRYVITPAAFGPRLGLPMLPWLLLGVALAAVLVARFARQAQGASLAALMVVSSILASPYALPHDLVGAMPALSLFILSSPSIAYFAMASAVFCGAFLPGTLPAACLLAVLHRSTSSSSTNGTIQTTRL